MRGGHREGAGAKRHVSRLLHLDDLMADDGGPPAGHLDRPCGWVSLGAGAWVRYPGDIRVPARVGAYVETIGVDVAIDGPGGVEHGVRLVGEAARAALKRAGYLTVKPD